MASSAVAFAGGLSSSSVSNEENEPPQSNTALNAVGVGGLGGHLYPAAAFSVAPSDNEKTAASGSGSGLRHPSAAAATAAAEGSPNALALLPLQRCPSAAGAAAAAVAAAASSSPSSEQPLALSYGNEAPWEAFAVLSSAPPPVRELWRVSFEPKKLRKR